ncbi:MAG: response regulator receiver protein [Deltaproteobacteria bacterium HGW-Deltaproteobacteria-15]|jgi:chemotaxis signal transduction protein/ABC-type nitrate/sulfonate/bicarbonate transport system substrate-binding protein|nr:MAG: response regulator receiver protein [Deltaproteobacteria bacterium HGW-Deltaproteobacteria-15]
MALNPDDIRILLVEDAAVMRKMEIKILNQLGFRDVLEAVDGNDAIEKLHLHKDIRLVLSDWAMPNKDGYELLKWVREQEEYRALPMIMATGQGDMESVSRAIEAGANGVVAKPFTPDDLMAQIEEAFGVEKAESSHPDVTPRRNSEGKIRIRIGHIQITDHLTLGIANHFIQKGIKAPVHFELETLCMPGWNPVQKALEQGDVDGAFILAPAAMDLFNFGIPIKLVLFAHRNGSIFVRSSSTPYRQPYQQFFKHKTVFIPHKMSIHNMLAHMYLTRMGLRPGLAGASAVNVLFDVAPPVKMPDFLAENPEACGFMVAEPIGTRAIAAGIAERQFLSSEVWENHPCCVVVFRDQTIAGYPDAVQEFCNLLVEAGRFIAEHPDQSAEIATAFLDPDQKMGLKPGLLKQVLTDPKGIRTDDLYPVLEDLDVIQQYMTKKMNIGSIIDLESFVDSRFAQEACKGGPKRKGSGSPLDLEDAGVELPARREIEKWKAGGAGNGMFDSAEPQKNLEGKYLTFGIASERYGISILDVREIIGMIPIRPVPHLPEFMKGVVNLRGKVIPVLDMRMKFAMEPIDYTDRTCIIVVEISGVKGSTFMGIVVDRVLEVSDIKSADIQECPNFGSEVNTEYILGIAKKADEVTILLEIDRILEADEKAHLAKAA